MNHGIQNSLFNGFESNPLNPNEEAILKGKRMMKSDFFLCVFFCMTPGTPHEIPGRKTESQLIGSSKKDCNVFVAAKTLTYSNLQL